MDAARCQVDCVAGIAADPQAVWTLGQAFLRSQYVVFDRDHVQGRLRPSAYPGSI